MIHQAAKNPWNCQGSHNPKPSCVVSSFCITVLDTHINIYITYQFDVFDSSIRACSHQFPGMLILMRCITGPGSDVRKFLSSPPCLEELIAFFSVLFPLSSSSRCAGAQCSSSFDYVCWCHTWGMAPNVKLEDSVCIIILHKSEKKNTCLEVATIVVNHLLVWSDATLILPKDWQCVAASCISTNRSRWFLFTKVFLMRSQFWHSKSLPQNHCL